MAEADDINKIFQIVDSDGSGYLDKEKLHRICPHLSSGEIDDIFQDLDTDHDNRISLKEFTLGFTELGQPTGSSHRSSNKQKATHQKRAFDIEEDFNTNMTPTQINEIFSSLSW